MTCAQLRDLGHAIDASAHARLARFVELLLDANERINLTAIRTPQAVWELHVCDALALLPALDARAPQSVLDLGTGGGLPGLPLACARPHMRFTLLDATRKKVDAVRVMAEGIGVENVSLLWGRAESVARDPEHRERYDLVLARAVAPLARLAGYASGLVRPGGECWFLKSCDVLAEVSAARAALAAARLAAVEPPLLYALPGAHGKRQVLRFRKLAPPTQRGAAPRR